MRTIIPHIIYRREPIKIKNKKHTFLSWNKSRLFVIVVVSFDNCPGESRGDFFWKKITKSVTLFEFFSILYMSPQEGLNNFMTFSWGARAKPGAFKKSDFYFLNYLSYYICKGAVQLPPYDTTAPLHRQQEPPRTATHSKTQKQDMQKTYAKNKERNFPAAAMILFSYLLRAVVHLPRGGATRKSSFLYYI